jgi:hypothetical protein
MKDKHKPMFEKSKKTLKSILDNGEQLSTANQLLVELYEGAYIANLKNVKKVKEYLEQNKLI